MKIAPVSTVNQYNTDKLSFKSVNKEVAEELLKKGNKIIDAVKNNGSNLTEETAKITTTAFEGILVALGLNNTISEIKKDKNSEDKEKEKILKEIMPIIAKNAGTASEVIKPENNFSFDLGCDSMDLTEIIIDIEEKYNLKLGTNEELEKIKTVQDLLDLTYSKNVEKNI